MGEDEGKLFAVSEEQAQSDGGKGVGEDGRERTEVSTNVTMAAGGEISGISGRAIVSASSFAGMLVLDTKNQE